MSFRWSSPTRRNSEGNILPPIPHEVYFAILDFFQPSTMKDDGPTRMASKRTMSNIALVCRFFGSIMIPRIFHFIGFPGSAHSEEQTPSYTSLCRAIIKNQKHARAIGRHVQECSFTSWIQDAAPTWTFNGFLKLYCNAISHMANIQTLVLICSPINKLMLRTIVKLKQLRALVIKRCQFDEDCSEAEIQKLSTLQLRSFHFTFGPDPFRYESDSHESLVSQTLNYSHMEELSTCSWRSVEMLAQETKELPLKILHISPVKNASFLCKIFENTPQLTGLSLHRVGAGYSESEFQLHPSSLPLLTHIRCPSTLLPCIVPGRPISVVSISAVGISVPLELDDSEFRVMKQSSRDIRTLDIPYDLYLAGDLCDYFPHLQDLLIDCAHYNYPLLLISTPEGLQQILTNIADAWPKNPPISRLTIELECIFAQCFLDLSNQHMNILNTLSPKFPHLMQVSFVSFLSWTKKRDDDGYGYWDVSLSPGFERLLVEMVGQGFEYVDHNGIFDAVLGRGNV